MTDNFTRNILKQIILKYEPVNDSIDTKIPYTSISENTLDILVDLIIYYIKNIAKEAIKIAEIGGRTEVNGFDVLDSLWSYHEDVFSLFRMVTSVGTPNDFQIKEYPIETDTQDQDEITFPYRAGANVENNENNEYLPPYIPQFFPSFSNYGFNDYIEQNFENLNFQIDNIQKPLYKINNSIIDNIVKNILNEN